MNKPDTRPQHRILSPLRIPLFRRIWGASLLSNLGFMILSVAAAWTMTLLTASANMVALVQTALMLPMMLLSLAAGAIADMYDRRKVGLVALCLSLLASAGLAVAMLSGIVTPWMLLAFCFLLGSGMAIFGPSWQASVSEQVPAEDLPQGVALNSISFNIARSFGPAIGGAVVAAAGSFAAFAMACVFYLPLFFVMLGWRRVPVPARLPPERIDRAISAGLRYALYSNVLRTVLIRTFAIGIAGSSVAALLPLIARDLVHGQAETYGILLGAYGIGAVVGAIAIGRFRSLLNNEQIVLVSTLLMAACVGIVAISPWVFVTVLALFGAGVGWMVAVTLFNIAMQTAVPRWVTGRTVAAFQTAIAAGIAIGSWLWGDVAQDLGVSLAVQLSALLTVATMLLGLVWRTPEIADADREAIEMRDPDVALALTGRSGPIVIDVEYRIAPEDARAFYNRMQAVRAMRLRNGAFGWSIARDISQPDQWFERFQYPTWHDYLRHRSRSTPEELAILDLARRYHRGEPELRVRRLLERPFGSVRWQDDAPAYGPDISGNP